MVNELNPTSHTVKSRSTVGCCCTFSCCSFCAFCRLHFYEGSRKLKGPRERLAFSLSAVDSIARIFSYARFPIVLYRYRVVRWYCSRYFKFMDLNRVFLYLRKAPRAQPTFSQCKPYLLKLDLSIPLCEIIGAEISCSMWSYFYSIWVK